MAYQEILYEKDDKGLALITLNRPESLNAFTPTLLNEWLDALQDAMYDHDVRVMMVTGAGRGFCSGANVRGFNERGAAGAAARPLEVYERRNPEPQTVHRFGRLLQFNYKPYIAAVNGPAAGGGMDSCNMADVRLMSDAARVGMRYIAMGIIPGDGGMYFLPRIIGLSRALEWMWTGRMIGAEEALRVGWANEVYPAEGFLDHAKEYAHNLCKQPAAGVQLIKRMAVGSMDQDRVTALEMSHLASVVNGTSPDTREGPRAWVEKREPVFSAR